MKATQKLYDLGQSLWLDNITRNILNSGLLQSYVNELAVTGLTSNPTIFDHAIKNSTDYDAAIRNKLKEGKSGEGLFFELALEDLTRAADLFRPIYERTCGVDGWVSLEVSPLLAHDTKTTLAEAEDLHARAKRSNLFIKIPGLKAFADHGEVSQTVSADGGDCEAVLDQFTKAGIDLNALAATLQDEGATSFVKSWNELMAVIESKSAALQETVSR